MKIVKRGNRRGQLIKAAAWGAGKLVRHVAKKYVAKRVEPGGKGSKSNDDAVMTNQYDTNLSYKRPKKKFKKRKPSFAVKVRNALEYTLADQELTRHFFLTAASTAGEQGASGYSLLGTVASGNPQLDDDLPQMFKSYEGGSLAGSHLLTKLARCDMLITNTGSNTLKATVYELVPKFDITNLPGVAPLIVTEWVDYSSTGETPQVPGLTSVEGITTPNAPYNQALMTPFNTSAFCARHTVLNKRDFILSAGQVATLSVSNNIKRKINYSKVGDVAGAHKGVTKFILITWHGVPSAGVGVANQSGCYPTATICVSGLKVLKYRILRDEYNRASATATTS